jgi:hypothetical protein
MGDLFWRMFAGEDVRLEMLGTLEALAVKLAIHG